MGGQSIIPYWIVADERMAIEMFWTPAVEETLGHHWLASSRLRPAREAWFYS